MWNNIAFLYPCVKLEKTGFSHGILLNVCKIKILYKTFIYCIKISFIHLNENSILECYVFNVIPSYERENIK